MRILRNFFIACVKAYRLLLAPLFVSLGVRCRFTPSCSEYAIGCLEAHGAGKGLALTAWRIARCHPFCPGGHDPVPRNHLELSHGHR
jgi:putative membrane protein insertion efficiency factor